MADIISVHRWDSPPNTVYPKVNTIPGTTVVDVACLTTHKIPHQI